MINKTLLALATSLTLLAAGTANAQIGKAASEATDAAQHKIDEKQADSKAKKSGPVGSRRVGKAYGALEQLLAFFGACEGGHPRTEGKSRV